MVAQSPVIRLSYRTRFAQEYPSVGSFVRSDIHPRHTQPTDRITVPDPASSMIKKEIETEKGGSMESGVEGGSQSRHARKPFIIQRREVPGGDFTPRLPAR